MPLLDSPEMIDDTISHTLQAMSGDFLKKQCIDRAARERIRDCERCRRVYGVGFDIVLEAIRKELPTFNIQYRPPFTVLEQYSRELNQCKHWPMGIEISPRRRQAPFPRHLIYAAA
jgi:hypothetical protein